MLLTVAIPTYNRSKNLHVTLTNFADQIKQSENNEIEIIVSDNCSTDDTERMCTNLISAYPTVNIKYYRNNLNLGFDRNVDKLFMHAEGQYVWTFSDDDLLSSGALAYTVNLLKQRVVTFAFANYRVNIEGKILPSRFNIAMDSWVDARQLLKKIRFSNSLISSCIFLREAWLTAKPEKFVGTQWIHFFVAREILQKGEGLIIGQPLFTMMQSGLDTSREERKNKDYKEIEFFMLAHLKFVEFSSELKNFQFDQETIEIANSIGKTEDIHQIINFKLTTQYYSIAQIIKTWRRMAFFRKKDFQFWMVITPLLFMPRWTFQIARVAYRFYKSCLS